MEDEGREEKYLISKVISIDVYKYGETQISRIYGLSINYPIEITIPIYEISES